LGFYISLDLIFFESKNYILKTLLKSLEEAKDGVQNIIDKIKFWDTYSKWQVLASSIWNSKH
jgi:hypothetical protein